MSTYPDVTLCCALVERKAGRGYHELAALAWLDAIEMQGEVDPIRLAIHALRQVRVWRSSPAPIGIWYPDGQRPAHLQV